MGVDSLGPALKRLLDGSTVESQRALAAACGVNETHVYNILAGRSAPSVPLLFSLLAHLGADLYDLADSVELVEGREPRTLDFHSYVRRRIRIVNALSKRGRSLDEAEAFLSQEQPGPTPDLALSGQAAPMSEAEVDTLASEPDDDEPITIEDLVAALVKTARSERRHRRLSLAPPTKGGPNP